MRIKVLSPELSSLTTRRYMIEIVKNPSTLSSDFSNEIAWQIVILFHMEPPWVEQMKECRNNSCSFIKMTPCPYMLKTF